MPTAVKIPSLGESITSGILATWHVSDGDVVASGQLLYELETDKITSEGLAEAGGRITLKIAEGDEVDIGQIVATIDESAAESTSGNAGDGAVGSPAPASKVAEQPMVVPSAVQSTSAPSAQSKTTLPAASEAGLQRAVTLPPAVRRLAAETGIDPSMIVGTGKDGRVTKSDMMAAAKAQKESPAAPAPPGPVENGTISTVESMSAAPPPVTAREQPQTAPRTQRKPMTPLRRRIAQRLVEAQQTAAILTTFNEADMSAIMALRKRHQEAFVKRHNVKLGFMSFFVKAVVHALKAVPQVNAQIEGTEIIENFYYDIGVAVSSDRGLLVPVLRNCDRSSFAEIEQKIIAYARKAREGGIKIGDLQGGTFTITNGGIFGSMLSTPILNPPQSGILGMHNIKERAVVLAGEIVIRPMMYLALSYDHRIVDGREAVTFLIKIKEAIEDPSVILFEL